MKILTLLILFVLEVSVMSDTRCACCFVNPPGVCETPAIDIGSCSNCTSWFCAMHVKGCQGPCNAVCQPGSNSSTTISSSTTTIGSILKVRVRVIQKICYDYKKSKIQKNSQSSSAILRNIERKIILLFDE
jgi:hypothetical protein